MRQILAAILKNRRLTRNELCHILNLSPAAIVKYTRSLVDAGLLRETEFAESSGAGRKSFYLELNPDHGAVIGLVLCRDKIQAAIITQLGEILFLREYPCSELPDQRDLMALIYAGTADSILYAKEKGIKTLGIGIAMGGHLDPRTGISHQYLFARDWYSVPVRDLVTQKFKLPVFLIKDTNACALGDSYFGGGLGVDNFLSVWMGTGLGMGIVINGINYIGGSGYAGELGHTRGGEAGSLCYCGRHGCLEGSTSQSYVLARCREGLHAGVVSTMTRLCGGDLEQLKISHAVAAAQDGDRLAQNIFAEVGERIGLALSDAANIFNPQLMLFHGPLIDGNEFLFDTIKRSIMSNALRESTTGLHMQYSERDNYVHLKGLCGFVVSGLAKEGRL